MGLKEKTIHASKWNIGSSVLGQVMQLFFSAVMARLLLPEDFGVFGMAFVFITFLQLFSQLGMGAALIQEKSLDEEDLSSVFWMNLASGIILCAIFILCAPFIAAFFRQPVLRKIVYVLSVNFIIVSLSMVQSILLTREMRFKKISVVTLASLACSGFLGIYLALNGFKVWSLVWSSVGGNIISTALMWYKSEWNPKFIFHWAKIRRLFSFGFNVLAANVVNYFARNIQDILIGRFLTPAALGYYSLANRIMLLPLQHITWRIGGVTFPAFSKIQHDEYALRDAYLKTVSLISIVTFPIMIGLSAAAPEIITTILGEKWMPAVILVQILCITGLIQSITSTIGAMILAKGRADLNLKCGLFSSPILCLGIAIGLKWGVLGVAITYSISYILAVSIPIFIGFRLISLKMPDFLKTLLPAAVSSLVMLACLIMCKYLTRSVLSLHNVLILLSLIMVGLLAYPLSLRILFRERFYELLEIAKIALPVFKK